MPKEINPKESSRATAYELWMKAPNPTGMDHLANFFVTLVIAYPLTWCLCLLIGKTKYIRVLFGMNKNLQNTREVQ